MYGTAPMREGVVNLIIDTFQIKVDNPIELLAIVDYTLQRKYETGAIRLLLDIPGMNVLHEFYHSFLRFAVNNPDCRPAAVKLFIERGAGVNEATSLGEISLHMVVKRTATEHTSSIIDVLLKSGSNVNLLDKCGESPLSLAVKNQMDTDILKTLLLSGARIGPRKDLLRTAFKFFDEVQGQEEAKKERLLCFELLLKYSLIERPDFDIAGLIEECNNCELVVSFANKCVEEMLKMNSLKIGRNLTLHDFIIRNHSVAEIDTFDNKPEANDYDFSQLLKIRADITFPIFFDVISSILGKEYLRLMLEKVKVYAVKFISSSTHMEMKVVLNYEIACKIAENLPNEDFLRLMLAFYKPDAYN